MNLVYNPGENCYNKQVGWGFSRDIKKQRQALMAEVFLVVSGKGGVGKSTVCSMVGAALSKRGKQILLLEMDHGLRGLDILNGIQEGGVYDLRDVVEGRCEPAKALLKSSLGEGLFLVPASLDRSFSPPAGKLRAAAERLSAGFDYVLVDCPAGLGANVSACFSLSKRALLVTCPDLLTARDAGQAASLLFEEGIAPRLVINRVPQRFRRTAAIPDLDAVIDLCGAQLIGVVPEDPLLGESLALGEGLLENASSRLTSLAAFSNIAARLEGEYVPLAIR